MRTACGSGSAPQLAGTAGPRARLDDGDVLVPVAVAERDAAALDARKPEIGDPVEPRGCAYRDLRCLRFGGIRRPTSVAGRRYPTVERLADHARGPFDAHAPELDSLRQDDDVRGETVPSLM